MRAFNRDFVAFLKSHDYQGTKVAKDPGLNFLSSVLFTVSPVIDFYTRVAKAMPFSLCGVGMT